MGGHECPKHYGQGGGMETKCLSMQGNLGFPSRRCKGMDKRSKVISRMCKMASRSCHQEVMQGP